MAAQASQVPHSQPGSGDRPCSSRQVLRHDGLTHCQKLKRGLVAAPTASRNVIGDSEGRDKWAIFGPILRKVQSFYNRRDVRSATSCEDKAGCPLHRPQKKGSALTRHAAPVIDTPTAHRNEYDSENRESSAHGNAPLLDTTNVADSAEASDESKKKSVGGASEKSQRRSQLSSTRVQSQAAVEVESLDAASRSARPSAPLATSIRSKQSSSPSAPEKLLDFGSSSQSSEDGGHLEGTSSLVETSTDTELVPDQASLPPSSSAVAPSMPSATSAAARQSSVMYARGPKAKRSAPSQVQSSPPPPPGSAAKPSLPSAISAPPPAPRARRASRLPSPHDKEALSSSVTPEHHVPQSTQYLPPSAAFPPPPPSAAPLSSTSSAPLFSASQLDQSAAVYPPVIMPSAPLSTMLDTASSAFYIPDTVNNMPESVNPSLLSTNYDMWLPASYDEQQWHNAEADSLHLPKGQQQDLSQVLALYESVLMADQNGFSEESSPQSQSSRDTEMSGLGGYGPEGVLLGPSAAATIVPQKPKATFPCPYADCPRHEAGLATNFKLKQHVATQHSPSHVRVPCGIDGCVKTFSRQDDLLKHQKTSREHRHKTIFCDCGKSFTRKDSLAAHQRKKCPLIV